MSHVSHESGDRPDLGALSAWAPELAKTFVSLASDIALVIDEAGVIRNVAQGATDPIAPGAHRWIGRAWVDTVSGDTRPKIENLLKEATTTGIARRREVNHLFGADGSVPVAYTAIRLGTHGPVLAVGRDLRTIAAIQQRYVESQQEIERGYWQARQAESRYELLFQVATDAVLVVDGETLRIVEANPAAAKLFEATAEQMQGRLASAAFEHHSRGAVNELLGSARASGRSGEIRARLQGTNTSTSVVAMPFRADAAMRLLVRMRTIDPGVFSAASSSAAVPSAAVPSAAVPSGAVSSPVSSQTLARLVDDTGDGVVVTDSSGRILVANPAFLALAGLPNETQAKGQPLMRWLSLGDPLLASLVATVRRLGIARQVGSVVRRGASVPVQVEISAALLTEGDQERIGFTIHPVERTTSLQGAEGETTDALARVLRAGIEALGAQLDDDALAAVVRDAAASLGLSTENFSRRLRQAPRVDTSTP